MVDPRIRRTLDALHAAVLGLAAAGELERATVEHILEVAGVARPTLYAHYRDKWALLDGAVDEALAAIREATERVLVDEQGAFTAAPMTAFFVAAGEHAAAIHVLLRNAGRAGRHRALVDELAAAAHPWFERQSAQVGLSPLVPMGLIVQQFSWSVVGTLAWWLEERPDLSAEEVADLFRTSSLRGRAWTMQLDGSDLHLPGR